MPEDKVPQTKGEAVGQGVKSGVFEGTTIRYAPSGGKAYLDLDFGKGDNGDVIINLGSFTGVLFKVNLYNMPGKVIFKIRVENKDTSTHVLLSVQDDKCPGSIKIVPGHWDGPWADPVTGEARNDKRLGQGDTGFSGLAYKVDGEYWFLLIGPGRAPLA